MFASTPEPPYYAVIFTSERADTDPNYAITAAQMEELAKQQEGFLGVEAALKTIGITVSYRKAWNQSKNGKTIQNT